MQNHETNQTELNNSNYEELENIIRECSDKIDKLEREITSLQLLKLSLNKLENSQVDYNNLPTYRGINMSTSQYAYAESTNQTIPKPGTGSTIIPLNGNVVSSSITNSGGAFTIPSDGVYSISFSFSLNDTNLANQFILLYTNISGTQSTKIINVRHSNYYEISRTYILKLKENTNVTFLLDSTATGMLNYSFANCSITRLDTDSAPL